MPQQTLWGGEGGDIEMEQQAQTEHLEMRELKQ